MFAAWLCQLVAPRDSRNLSFSTVVSSSENDVACLWLLSISIKLFVMFIYFSPPVDFTNQQKEGCLCLYSIKNPAYPEYAVITESPIICLDVYKETPYLICVGKKERRYFHTYEFLMDELWSFHYDLNVSLIFILRRSVAVIFFYSQLILMTNYFLSKQVDTTAMCVCTMHSSLWRDLTSTSQTQCGTNTAILCGRSVNPFDPLLSAAYSL